MEHEWVLSTSDPSLAPFPLRCGADWISADEISEHEHQHHPMILSINTSCTECSTIHPTNHLHASYARSDVANRRQGTQRTRGMSLEQTMLRNPETPPDPRTTKHARSRGRSRSRVPRYAKSLFPSPSLLSPSLAHPSHFRRLPFMFHHPSLPYHRSIANTAVKNEAEISVHPPHHRRQRSARVC